MGAQENELTIEQIQSVLDAESDLYDFFERSASAGWPVTKEEYCKMIQNKIKEKGK